MVNVGVHEEISVPGLKKKLDENGEEIEGMNIPMSVGPQRNGKDKSGKDCYIYDVIVNPEVVEEAIQDSTGKYRDFICQLAIQSIEQKYKKNFDKRYKLPKLKYMGDVEAQYIQDRKNVPVIEEVSTKPSIDSTKDMNKKSVTSSTDVKDTLAVSEIDLPITLKYIELQLDGTSKENLCQYEDIAINTYREPSLTIPDNIIRLELSAYLSTTPSVQEVDVRVSPYKLQVRFV